MGRPRLIKRYTKAPDYNQGKLGENGTGYQNTFIAHKNFVPRKNMKPPPTPPLPRHPPMEGQTTTMECFQSQDLNARRGLIVPVEKHEVSDEPLSSMTIYRNDFVPKDVLPPVLVKAPQTKPDDALPKVKFDGKTMNKEFFKDWKAGRRPKFSELASFSAPLIYPHKRDIDSSAFKTRTQIDYPSKKLAERMQAKTFEANIKVGEGNHSHETTHRTTYKFDSADASSSDERFTKTRTVKAKPAGKLPNIDFTTKYLADFPRDREYQAPRKPSTPAPATLEIKMSDELGFETEQRKQFHGWNVEEHRRPELAKLSDNTQLATDPMQTNTTMTRDFTPKELLAAVVSRGAASRPHTNRALERGKFEGTTMNKVYFKDWQVNKRPRYGDFHEACNEIVKSHLMRPAQEFSSTTKSTFIEKQGRPRTSMKPTFKTIDTTQLHDFNTTSMNCFKHPPASAYEIEDVVVKC